MCIFFFFLLFPPYDHNNPTLAHTHTHTRGTIKRTARLTPSGERTIKIIKSIQRYSEPRPPRREPVILARGHETLVSTVYAFGPVIKTNVAPGGGDGPSPERTLRGEFITRTRPAAAHIPVAAAALPFFWWYFFSPVRRLSSLLPLSHAGPQVYPSGRHGTHRGLILPRIVSFIVPVQDIDRCYYNTQSRKQIFW